jgi:hypothetical protein
MDWDKVKVEFSPDNRAGNRWRCPFCNVEFYGGGPAVHAWGECLNECDYDQMVYVVTPNGVADMLSGRYTFDGCGFGILEKSDIYKQITHRALQQWAAQGKI